MEARVLLLHPGVYDAIPDYSYPPWGILNVGAACRKLGIDVELVDLNGLCIPREVDELIKAYGPTVVAMTAKLGNASRRAMGIVEAVRHNSDASIAIGGPLVSTFPNSRLDLWQGVDALFLGDGEDAFPEWVVSGCSAKGLLGPFEASSLDVVGLPTWWSGLGPYVSDAECWPGLKVRSLHVSAARGCTRRCTFCYLHEHVPGKRFRRVSPGKILEGCDNLNERWGAEGFYFVDDCLVAPGDPETELFFKLLMDRGSPYRFGCDVQLQELEDRMFLDRMYAAGFRSLYVGVEAASAAVRKRLGKGAITTPLRELLRRTMERGFSIRASIGVGWPDETAEEMRATVELAESLPGLMFDAFRYTPLPGAPLSKYWSRRGGKPADDGPDELTAFEDYSEYSRNYSTASAEVAEDIWQKFRTIEQERHAAYFRVQTA